MEERREIHHRHEWADLTDLTCDDEHRPEVFRRGEGEAPRKWRRWASSHSGRFLAYVYVGDFMVDAELVRQGYAQMATLSAHVMHQTRCLERPRRRGKRSTSCGESRLPGDQVYGGPIRIQMREESRYSGRSMRV
jgi:hypothetical protein